MSSIAGEFVTETFEYDGGRQVTVYVPPARPRQSSSPVTVSDLAVGQVLEAADVPSTMIVGAHRLADETLRLHEYSPGFDPERFAAHEKFFVEDVRRWAQRVRRRLPADRTAVFGVSASGELALAMGLRHPDIYGAVFCASPGGGYHRLTLCRARFRARTLSRAPWSRSSTRTRPGGRPRCAMQVRTL